MTDLRVSLRDQLQSAGWPNPVHNWLGQIHAAFAPGHSDPVLDIFEEGLSAELKRLGQFVTGSPEPDTSLILTSAPFGEPLNWRTAKMFTARRTYDLRQTPVVITMLHASHQQLAEVLTRLERALRPPTADPQLFDFDGLAPSAYKTLFEQGSRGGPVMALARLLQSQAKCIRILLVVGDQTPDYAYLFDLVGAHPRISGADPEYFYRDIALRILTAMSTGEVTNHQVQKPPISADEWSASEAPAQMRAAASELGKRKFFTEMVVVANLVHVPSISAAVSDQYSEGCFATWSPDLDALIATVTGSARPVEKDAITEDDLAVITGIRQDGAGAIVRHVEGKRNDSPSSESVEMIQMDLKLPRIKLPAPSGHSRSVPVVRSKLHGHRGVLSFDPQAVEFVPLDPPYYTYPVSCATEAQARGIVQAFSRSEALRNPDDPRQAVFTVLPGHGLMLVEKWVAGKDAFQHLCDLMDTGALEVDNRIPQGPLRYTQQASGRMTLEEIPPKWLQQP